MCRGQYLLISACFFLGAAAKATAQPAEMSYTPACVESDEPFRYEGKDVGDFLDYTLSGRRCFSSELEEVGLHVVWQLGGQVLSLERQTLPPEASAEMDAVTPSFSRIEELFPTLVPQTESKHFVAETLRAKAATTDAKCKTCYAFEYDDSADCSSVDGTDEKTCYDKGKYTHAGKDYTNCKWDAKENKCNSSWKTISSTNYEYCLNTVKKSPAESSVRSCVDGQKGCEIGCILIKRGDSLAEATEKEGCTCTALNTCGHGRPQKEVFKLYKTYIEGGATVINDSGCSTFQDYDAMLSWILSLQASLPEDKCVVVKANQVVGGGCNITDSYSSTIRFKICGGKKKWDGTYGSCKPGGLCFPGADGKAEESYCCQDQDIKCALCGKDGTWQISDAINCKKTRWSAIACAATVK